MALVSKLLLGCQEFAEVVCLLHQFRVLFGVPHVVQRAVDNTDNLTL